MSLHEILLKSLEYDPPITEQVITEAYLTRDDIRGIIRDISFGEEMDENDLNELWNEQKVEVPGTLRTSQDSNFDLGDIDEIFSQKISSPPPLARKPSEIRPPERKPLTFTKKIPASSSGEHLQEREITSSQPSQESFGETIETNVRKTDFRTARKELQVQNLLNYGKKGATTAPGGANNVSGLFKPTAPSNGLRKRPISRADKENEADKSSEEDVPEQLKHIDPKIIELINSEIMMKVSSINWKDIMGLNYAKNVIQEAIVMPMLRPDIFTGLRRPPRGVLLFGPPGTGKTLIGKCIASQVNATFFNISASSLTSKYVGEGEKMVRALFAVASVQQPSVIFIDEIDSLLCQRSENEHESSRRLKTEFLVHLDGAATSESELVLVVGATNRPQELDEAVRRRFVRRLYIPLPCEDARLDMVKGLLTSLKHSLNASEIRRISQLTEGFSGADMRCLCQEASMGPLRSIPMDQFRNISNDEVRAVNYADFEAALKCIRPSVSEADTESYIKWNNLYGSSSNPS